MRMCVLTLNYNFFCNMVWLKITYSTLIDVVENQFGDFHLIHELMIFQHFFLMFYVVMPFFFT